MVDHFHSMPKVVQEAVGQLGSPESVHRSDPAILAKRFFWGILCLIFDVVLYAILRENDVFTKRPLALLIIFNIAVLGFTLLFRAWRDRNIWVLRYPQGVFVWRNGLFQSMAWADTMALVLTGIARCGKLQGQGNPDGSPRAAWLPIERLANRLLGPQLLWVTEDRRGVRIPSIVTQFADLCTIIQQETFRALWPKVLQLIRQGGTVRFGAFQANLNGLNYGIERIDWDEIEDTIIAGDRIQIRIHDQWRPWAKENLSHVSNIHLLLALMIVIPQEEERQQWWLDAPRERDLYSVEADLRKG